MTQTKRKPDHPSPQPGAGPADSDHAEHGIPPEVHDAEPTGTPDSGRHQTEVTPTKP